jgi:hypothetical protein
MARRLPGTAAISDGAATMTLDHATFDATPAKDRVSALRPKARSVDPAEFCKVLLSRRHVVRFDAPDGSMRGLLDVTTRELFQVDQELLDQFVVTQAGNTDPS